METGTLQKHTESHASDIDIVPLVETVLDDERIEIASRKPASGDNDENIKQNKLEHVEDEVEITIDKRFEITTEILTELNSSLIGTEITLDSNMQLLSSTTETLQVRNVIASHHRRLKQNLFVMFEFIINL